MKFTENDFSEKLKEKLTNKGKKPMNMSERTFKKLVAKIFKRMEKNDDESEIDDAVEDYIEDFTEIEGNYNKDRADFVNKFKAEWKKNHNANDDDEVDDDDDEGEGGTRKSSKESKKGKSKLDLLMEQIRELKEQNTKREKEESIAKKRKELKSVLKKEGIKDKEWIDGYIKKLNITDETDVDDEADDALKLYNRQTSDVKNETDTPGRTSSSSGEPDLKYLGIE